MRAETTETLELLRPLSARSVIASALLGSHPPRLPGRLLVALAAEFAIEGGTARVALSRMVDRGELVNDDGHYELAGSLARRQERQDMGRGPVGRSGWDGMWEQAIVVESGRTAADRNRLRVALAAARLGEAREGVWMRPANLDRPTKAILSSELSAHVLWFLVAPTDSDTSTTLADQLFDVGGWANDANSLIDTMQVPSTGLAARFRLAAAVLQHMTRDPLLPVELHRTNWPADELRDVYRGYELALQAELRSFFAAAR